MELFYIDCDVVNIKQQAKKELVCHLLVDSGSENTWIPEEVLKRIGVPVFKKDEPFLMANGETITRSVGYALLQADGFKTVDEVVFAQSGDLSLLGARTLEGFGATVDPRRKKLMAAGPRPAACGRHLESPDVPLLEILKAKLERAETAVQQGEVLSHGEVIKRSQEWFTKSGRCLLSMI